MMPDREDRNHTHLHTFSHTVAMARQRGAGVIPVEKERVADSAFGRLLRRHRLAMGLSQEVLAERARMSVNGIGALERGDRQHPYRETVVLLATALGLTPAAAAEFEAAAARPRRRYARGDFGAAAYDAGESATNLTAPRSNLVGREVAVAGIVSMLERNRLVTVTGAGGVGKTRVAFAVGEAFILNDVANVRLVELAPVTRGSSVESAVAQALHVRDLPERPLLETIVAQLRAQAQLLILDNCEHVIAEVAAFVDALLRRCSRLRVLTTSRAPLRIAGEQLYRLPSLDVPAPDGSSTFSAADALGYSAVLLFTERARAVEQGFSLNDDNAPFVVEICRRLDGIPLAIELAAARANSMPVRELLTKLDQRLRILTNGDRLSLPRHQTMRALVDWSFYLLSEAEQTLLIRLGIFAAGFTAEAAEAVCAYTSLETHDVYASLLSLIEQSIVVTDASKAEVRYRLLQTTREYALERLVASDRATIARRHAEWFASFVERVEAEIWTTPAVVWLPSVRAELDNLRSALAWALGAEGDVRIGALIAGSLQECWLLSGLLGEGRHWIETCLSRLKPGAEPAVEGRLWWALAALGVGKQSVDAAERAISLFEIAGDRTRLACAYASLALAYRQTSLNVDAERAINRAIALYCEIGQTSSMLYALAIGGRAMIIGDRDGGDEARALLRKAITICAGFGDDLRAAIPRIAVAEFEFLAGHVRRAAVLTEATAMLCHRDGDAMREAQALHCSAAFRIVLGEICEAKSAAESALRLARQTQSLLGLALSLTNLATVAALQGDVRRAARVHGYADAWLRARGYGLGGSEREARDVLCRALVARLTDVDIRELLADGAGLSEDAIVDMALSDGDSDLYDRCLI